MSKRLAFLEKLVADGKADSFARYALALEYKGLGRTADARAAFDALREADPKYVPMYLMCGTMLRDAGDAAEARAWIESGLAMATSVGNSHALGELRDALASLG